MLDQPLQPFSPPTAFLDKMNLPGFLPAELFSRWLLVAVCAFWALYTIVGIYHWMKYSHGSWVAVPAIVVHIGVSLLLIIYTLTGTFLL